MNGQLGSSFFGGLTRTFNDAKLNTKFSTMALIVIPVIFEFQRITKLRHSFVGGVINYNYTYAMADKEKNSQRNSR